MILHRADQSATIAGLRAAADMPSGKRISQGT